MSQNKSNTFKKDLQEIDVAAYLPGHRKNYYCYICEEIADYIIMTGGKSNYYCNKCFIGNYESK